MSNSMIMAAALAAVITGWVMREIAWHRRLGIWRIDQVTGLPVRQAFYRDARAVLRQPGVVLILLDLDDFKAVNDTYGHIAGDRVLSVIGARLREFFGSHAALGRLGGDEFAGLTQLGPASGSWRETLTRLPVRLAEPIPLPGGATVAVRASIGAVHLNQTRRPNMSAALQRADSLLYQAKRANGMRFHVVEPGDPTVTRSVDEHPYHRHRYGAGGAGHDTDERPVSAEVSARTPLPS